MADQLDFSLDISPQFKIKQIIKRDGRVVAFDPDKITGALAKAAQSVGESGPKAVEELTGKVVAALHANYSETSQPSIEEIQDIVEKVLIENGRAKMAKAYILYRAEHARLRQKKSLAIAVEDNIPYKLLWKAYTWNVEHDCDTVAKLNAQMQDGRWQDLLFRAEEHYHSQVKTVAQALLDSHAGARIFIVAGPSSSGKTTTTIKIGEALAQHGVSFRVMNLDNYFHSLDPKAQDAYGDYDFEHPHALDLPLIDQHLVQLLDGKTIRMPKYDFKRGVRVDNVVEMKLHPGEIILIDSLHGLFEEMTQSIPRDKKFKFYIEALCQIKNDQGEFVRWTDLRLLRRMIRDSLHRSYQPEQTVGHWHYVRRAEMKHIVPYIKTADFVFNGSLPYELPVHKIFSEKQFPQIVEKFEQDPHKTDAAIRAQRVYKLLQSLVPFADVDAIPRNSFIREFIGGSVYKY